MVLIDDYAHHPEEIKQVYKTLKLIYPNENLLVVFSLIYILEPEIC